MEYKASVFYEGGEVTYTFPFYYLKKKFVKVRYRHKDGTFTNLNYGTDYTVSDHMIYLSVAGSTEDTINIYRQTPTDQIVKFTDASVLRAYDLNVFQIQLLHIAEEENDTLLTSAMIWNDTNNVWDAKGRRISDVGDPVDPQDVVTKASLENTLHEAGTSAIEAAASVEEAKGYAEDALRHAEDALRHAEDAAHNATNAKTADYADAAHNATNAKTADYADTAGKLSSARKINITGDATGAATFDGSSDVSINVNVNESEHALTANAINSLGVKPAIGNGTKEPNGLELYQVYKNGYPAPYGNLLSIGGGGGGELLAEWSGVDKGIGHLYYRNRRDAGNVWSDWRAIAFVDDVSNYVNSVNTGSIVAASLTMNGYVKFANGFIIQWGYFPATSVGYADISFPIAFPTACLNVQKTSAAKSDIVGDERYIRDWNKDWNKTGFHAGYAFAGCSWLAVGY